MRRRVIYYTCSISFDDEGGGLTHVKEVVANLRDLGYIVYVWGAYDKNRLIVDKFTILFRIRRHSIFSRIFFQIKLALSLFFMYMKIRPDIIYNRQNTTNIVPAIYALITHAPLISEVNGILTEELPSMYGISSRLASIGGLVEKISYKISRKIIVVTEGIKKYINEKFEVPEGKVSVIPNGVNTELFYPVNREVALQELGLNNDFKFVVFVGSLVEWQGIDYLIKASLDIIQKIPMTKFIIVGDGIMREKWIKLVRSLDLKEFFIFTGKVSQRDVMTYINASDVCVAPFIKKRNKIIGLSPLKIYEYWACRKPVVTSDLPDINYLLNKYGGGIVVTPENSEKLAKAIINLLNNDELRKQMGENGRKLAVGNFSWYACAKRIDRIIRIYV